MMQEGQDNQDKFDTSTGNGSNFAKNGVVASSYRPEARLKEYTGLLGNRRTRVAGTTWTLVSFSGEPDHYLRRSAMVIKMRELWTDPSFLAAISSPQNGGAVADHPNGSLLHTNTLSAAPAGPPAMANASPPDKTTKLLQELDRLEKALAEYKKKLAGKPISKDQQKKLDEMQAKIDGVIKQLQAEGEVIAVSAAGRPPGRPSDADGEIQYEGIPLDKLKGEREKNIARQRARTVRDGMKSLDATAKRLDEKSAEHMRKQAKYEAVMSHSEDVNAAFTKDLQGGGFKKLSKAAPMFGPTLAAYQQAASDVSISLLALKEQAYRIAAAAAMVQQAEMLLDSYNTEKDRDAEGQKLTELKDKLEGLKSGVNFVIDAAKDPKGAAKDVAKKIGLKIKDALVDEIVDGLLGGEKLKAEMAGIERRMASLNQRLEDLKVGGLNTQIKGASSSLDAEVQKNQQAQEALKKAKRAEGQAVDQLADMERDHPNTTTVFGQMQRFYGEVQNAGYEAMQESKNYQGELEAAQAGMSHTGQIRETVQGDRAAMDKLYPLGTAEPEDLKQMEQERAIVDYTRGMDEWYKSKGVEQQIQEQRKLQDNLRDNRQFDYVGQLVNQVQKQGLDHVQDDKKITQ